MTWSEFLVSFRLFLWELCPFSASAFCIHKHIIGGRIEKLLVSMSETIFFLAGLNLTSKGHLKFSPLSTFSRKKNGHHYLCNSQLFSVICGFLITCNNEVSSEFDTLWVLRIKYALTHQINVNYQIIFNEGQAVISVFYYLELWV